MGVGGALCLAYVSVVVVCAVGVRGVFVGANGGKGDFGEMDGGDGGVASEHSEFIEYFRASLENFLDGGSFIERLPVYGPVGQGDGGVPFGFCEDDDAFGGLLSEFFKF